MISKLAERLNFALPPVAVCFTEEKPEGAAQFKEGVRGCVATMLVAAARGSVAVFDERTYGCPGGGVGLCFGNAFEKNSHPTEYLLSTGDAALAAHGKTHGRSLGRGERFFDSPETAGKWKAAFPYADAPEKYVVFMPLQKASAPDIVIFFANPDQLSALITLAGFKSGEGQNAVAPFGAACHSIAYAYREMGKERPQAILGFFDISQRHGIPKELLSFTVPFRMYTELEDAVDEGCLATEEWAKIEGRWNP